MSTPESAVVRACLDYLQIIGVVAWRNNTTGIYDLERQTYRKNAGRNGIADIVGCLPGGRFLAVECKAGRGKMSPHQIEFQKDIIKSGGLHVVAYQLEDLIEAIQRSEPLKTGGVKWEK